MLGSYFVLLGKQKAQVRILAAGISPLWCSGQHMKTTLPGFFPRPNSSKT